MIITIASGKGGTGKTTVASNLFATISDRSMLLDCDVEEPNSKLFLDIPLLNKTVVSTEIPKVDQTKCTLCRKCSDFCRYNAIITLADSVKVYSELCHSCGGWIVCPENAISTTEKKIGEISFFGDEKKRLIQGKIEIGVVLTPALISKVKDYIDDEIINIIDAPPGTSCPVVETVTGSDFVVLVTEPTPFGLHDLKLSIDLLREMEISFAVVINRAGIGNDDVKNHCVGENIPVLAEIPNDLRIAKVYSSGKLILNELPEYKDLFSNLFERIVGLV